MIDLHNHILPGLDDGAADTGEALAMAQLAVSDGIRVVVATPHVITGLYNNSRDKILAAAADFNRLLAGKNIPLSVLPGAEYRLEPDLPARLHRGELLTINDGGLYLLLELPPSAAPDWTSRVIYELQLGGVTPIIAHPERNAVFTGEPELLYHLISRGALAQVTAGSLTGLFGSEPVAAARTFIAHGCCQFLVSDAHSPRGRKPALAAAAAETARLFGRAAASRLVMENPTRALQAERIQPAGLKEIKPARAGFLKRIFGR